MSSTRINLTVDETAKKEAAELFNAFGMDISTAVNIYFKTVARLRKIPFEISLSEEKKDVFSMSTDEFMNRVRLAVQNRDNPVNKDYVISMDVDEKIPYRLYADGRREYIEE